MNDTKKQFSDATLTAQGLGWIEQSTGGITPAIYPSAPFQRQVDGNTYAAGKVYGRDENPTFLQVESLINKLEQGEEALVFASGMAACSSVLLALPAGSHIVVPNTAYVGFLNWCKDIAPNWGYRISYYDNDNLNQLKQAVTADTQMVWIETPGNPIWNVTDIQAVSDYTKSVSKALVVVDNTVPTPILTKPIKHGADIVVHSATKYLNGHHDVLAGAAVTRDKNLPLWQMVKRLRRSHGGILGVFEAWLLLRGMNTLDMRVKQSSQNAMMIAQHFEKHAAISRVRYPGLISDSGHKTATKQMQGGFSGMLAIEVAAGKQAALDVCKHVQVFKCATSLGGTESLIEHRATVEESDVLPNNLLRLSVGCENVQDLIDDLEQALHKSTSI